MNFILVVRGTILAILEPSLLPSFCTEFRQLGSSLSATLNLTIKKKERVKTILSVLSQDHI
jgi:hypothetical protein